MKSTTDWTYCPRQAELARRANLEETAEANRIANIARKEGFSPGPRVKDLMWGERSADLELQHRSTKEWERLCKWFRGKLKHSVVRIVWWDYISLRPADQGNKWWDKQISKIGAHAEDRRLAEALQVVGYTPYKAWKRILKPRRRR